jgi:hypothetical protein
VGVLVWSYPGAILFHASRESWFFEGRVIVASRGKIRTQFPEQKDDEEFGNMPL